MAKTWKDFAIRCGRSATRTYCVFRRRSLRNTCCRQFHRTFLLDTWKLPWRQHIELDEDERNEVPNDAELEIDTSKIEFLVENPLHQRYRHDAYRPRPLRSLRCVRRSVRRGHNNNPRFVRHGRTFDHFMIANACMHCMDPVCMIGCPTAQFTATHWVGRSSSMTIPASVARHAQTTAPTTISGWSKFAIPTVSSSAMKQPIQRS